MTVSFNISWVLLKPFLKFFFEIFLKIERQKFQGSSRLWRKIEKNGKTPNFCQKSYFLRLNLYCTCSQLSFEVYNSSLAKDFIFFQFFFQFFQFFKILNSAVCSGKSMLLWGLFVVSMES